MADALSRHPEYNVPGCWTIDGEPGAIAGAPETTVGATVRSGGCGPLSPLHRRDHPSPSVRPPRVGCVRGILLPGLLGRIAPHHVHRSGISAIASWSLSAHRRGPNHLRQRSLGTRQGAHRDLATLRPSVSRNGGTAVDSEDQLADDQCLCLCDGRRPSGSLRCAASHRTARPVTVQVHLLSYAIECTMLYARQRIAVGGATNEQYGYPLRSRLGHRTQSGVLRQAISTRLACAVDQRA